MPRDTTDFEHSGDMRSAAHMASTIDTVPACYLCGAWADDAKRCRHPGSTSCIQVSARFAVALPPTAGGPWPISREDRIRH